MESKTDLICGFTNFKVFTFFIHKISEGKVEA